MNAPTRTDPLGAGDRSSDTLAIGLHVCGTDQFYPFPAPGLGEHEWKVGAAKTAWLSIQDKHRFVSRTHALLRRESDAWVLRDAGSKNGLWENWVRREIVPLGPGVEVRIGSYRLVAETRQTLGLRALLGRLLGWDRFATVDRAMELLRAASTLREPLHVSGDTDLVAVARRIHRELLRSDRSFVVADPRRHRAEATARAPINYPRGVDAYAAAANGTLCVWPRRPPPDFNEVLARFGDPTNRVRLVLLWRVAPGPGTTLDIPDLGRRRHELGRVIREYANEAIETLRARPDSFTSNDLDWLVARRPASLAEVERGTLRLVAIREWGGVTRAARRVGISHSALSRWVGDKGLPA